MRRVYRIDWKKDYEFLKQKLCGVPESFGFEEEDLKMLRCGEETFLWESPLAASTGEAVNLARQAAAEMTPWPGRVVLAALLYIMMGSEDNYECSNPYANAVTYAPSPTGKDTLHAIEAIVNAIVMQTSTSYVSWGPCDEKGIRFLLATSEGWPDEENGHNDPGYPPLFLISGRPR